MEYLSIRQTSEKWGITVRRIQVLCTEGRIPGATKKEYKEFYMPMFIGSIEAFSHYLYLLYNDFTHLVF